MKNKLLRIIPFVMASVLVVSLPSCGEDDPQPETVEVSLQQTDFYTYVTKGTIELPVTITGLSDTPELSKLGLVCETKINGDFTYDWTGNGSVEQGESNGSWDLEIESIEKTGDDSYVVSISYDLTGTMDGAFIYDLYYDSSKAEQSFRLDYYTMSYNTVGVEAQEFANSSLPTTLRISVSDALTELGVTPADFYDADYRIYCAIYGDSPNMETQGWNGYSSAFVGKYYDQATSAAGLSILGVKNLAAGKTYVAQMIFVHDGQYKGVCIPFSITAEN